MFICNQVVAMDGQAPEQSKVEFMAQKQNKIAQHFLNCQMDELEKEITLYQLSHRTFVKQLRSAIAGMAHLYDIPTLHRTNQSWELKSPMLGNFWALQTRGYHDFKGLETSPLTPILHFTFPFTDSTLLQSRALYSSASGYHPCLATFMYLSSNNHVISIAVHCLGTYIYLQSNIKTYIWGSVKTLIMG